MRTREIRRNSTSRSPSSAAAPDRAATLLLRGGVRDSFAASSRRRCSSRSEPWRSIRSTAAVYDVLGAAHLKLQQPDQARVAFETSLRFNAHDSTAYTNLGLLALAAGNNRQAEGFFAEALWLKSASITARQGLAQTRRTS